MNDADFIEYRRNKKSKNVIHYGVENPIIDRIEPSALVGVKPEHGRWLLNKAAKTTSKQKGELLIHFREGTPMFFGVSPMGTELSLEYGAYGKEVKEESTVHIRILEKTTSYLFRGTVLEQRIFLV